MANSDPSTTDLTANFVSPGKSSFFNNFAYNDFKTRVQGVLPGVTLSANPTVEEIQAVLAQLRRLSTPSGAYDGSAGTQPFVFSFQNLSKQFPGPSKFYTGSNLNNITKQRWVLPVPPADFSVAVPNSQSEVTTISGFTYTHAGPIQLDEISFEGFFPQLNDAAGSPLPQFLPDYITLSNDSFGYAYHSPQEWVSNIVTAMRANQPLIFSVYTKDSSGSAVITDEGMVIQPVAMSISSFDWSMGASVGGSRRDINYSITLKRWRRQSLTLTNYVRQPNLTYGSSQTWPAGSGNSGGNLRVYTVINRDTLFKIAAKPLVLGNGRRWREIYEKNKKDIDKDYKQYLKEFAAKNPRGTPKRRHVYPISPNLVLRIPKK